MEPLTVKTAGVLDLSDDELFRLCAANRDLQIERDANGSLIFMSPTGSRTSAINSEVLARLWIWNRDIGRGKVFDSSGGFTLPDGSMRSPDAAWIPIARWEQFSAEEQERFLPLCPDFAVEIRSPSDRLADLQKKMEEWIANGCRLAWLIDPVEEQAYVYRQRDEPEVVSSFDEVLVGGEVLPGFELKLRDLR